ncbi:TIGR03668 family PPOX class F420-dependent oxidoreductase [Prauserella cavernicola]|uniref:TIGR03668 family PPOX class F420-dependent oxidoreductase n=1 Tax=Prauserella cavernicola TaxID=2800127 RepID=A0A934V402_9PSEU|nr:TIGR03668 family PPOX class F420-dependent oxidoreductase [Prauserella cavernicola]MBK1783058.1 TIGR03668 family PPOX class F420-dependent oxidoreductase [Prauserella cavernicola]
MRLDEREARRRFAGARVARLATVGADGTPHLVPVTFAVAGGTVAFVIDAKPKSTTDLRRLRNIAANPNVSFLVDHYDDDWTRLWWVRADGAAATVPAEGRLYDLLREKYPQYVDTPPEGPLVRTEVSAWRGWSARR